MFVIKNAFALLMGFGATLSLAMSGSALAIPTATATLSSFIQNGTINNNVASGANITQIVYSLGTPADNLATWDTSTGGGVASNFLSNPQYFQTLTWGGLSIAPGSSFSFSGLDIDLIVTLSPLNVTGSILGGAETLRNASLSIFWSDRSSGSSALVQQAWSSTQNLTINGRGGNGVVPEPASLALLGIGLAGLGAMRRRKTT